MLPDFLNSTGLLAALEAAADQFRSAMTVDLQAAAPWMPALKEAIATFSKTDAFRTAVVATISDVVPQVLGDTELQDALQSAISTLVSDLLSSPAAQTMISDEVSSMVSNALGGGAWVRRWVRRSARSWCRC